MALASWICPGCATQCKFEVPNPLPAISLPIPSIPSLIPDIKIPKLPKLPKIPIPPFNFGETCPSKGRKD